MTAKNKRSIEISSLLSGYPEDILNSRRKIVSESDAHLISWVPLETHTN